MASAGVEHVIIWRFTLSCTSDLGRRRAENLFTMEPGSSLCVWMRLLNNSW